MVKNMCPFILHVLLLISTPLLATYAFADSKDKKTNTIEEDPGKKLGKRVFGEWLVNLAVSGTEQVWDYFYYRQKEKSTLFMEKETYAKLTLHFSNPYSHVFHYGLRFHDIIYYYRDDDTTTYVFSPEFTFGRNIMFTNWFGFRLYGGVGPWISIISTGNRQTEIAWSFGLQMPIRIGKRYATTFVEYNINTLKGLNRSIIYGIGIAW